jgi:hypothetical protein
VDTVIRLLLRVIIVPLGYLAAILAGVCIIMFGNWQFGAALMSPDPAYAVFGLAVAGPVLFIVLTALMFLPAALGILISEAFAIRSWIYHALCGAASGWVGWQMMSGLDSKTAAPLIDQPYVFAAGLAGGFAYWAVAGWSAGFWKPVFAQPAPAVLPPPAPAPPNPFAPPAAPLPPPAATPSVDPFSPPARTEP